MKKVYVKVNVDFDSDGNMVPKRIIWEDGTDYEIDSILSYSPREARKDIGAAGERWVVRIRGRQAFLYYDILPPKRWFVAAKD